MDLETLRKRKVDLETAGLQLASQWQVLQGQKLEVEAWIADMEQKASEADCTPTQDILLASEAEAVVE